MLYLLNVIGKGVGYLQKWWLIFDKRPPVFVDVGGRICKMVG